MLDLGGVKRDKQENEKEMEKEKENEKEKERERKKSRRRRRMRRRRKRQGRRRSRRRSRMRMRKKPGKDERKDLNIIFAGVVIGVYGVELRGQPVTIIRWVQFSICSIGFVGAVILTIGGLCLNRVDFLTVDRNTSSSQKNEETENDNRAYHHS